MAQYKKIDGQCSNHLAKSKSQYFKEEHLEIELFQRDSDLRHRQLTCIKNPGHEKLVPINELTLDNFPLPLRHQCVMDYVTAFSPLVVRIKVKHTSSGRAKDDPFHKIVGRCVYRGATGCVDQVVDVKNIHEFPCKDDACILSGTDHYVYGFIDVWTNRHVVFDTKEAQSTEVEFFFDSPDRQGVVTLKGHDVRKDATGNDDMVLLRCLSHDTDFIPKIHRLVEEAKVLGAAIPRSIKDSSMTDYAIVVSHPHGTLKTFSVGELMEYHKIPDKAGFLSRFLREHSWKHSHRLRVSIYTTPTCPGCSGAPVVTGYDDGWSWWKMCHSTADLVSGMQLAFTYR
ncbi:hypothetical protein Bpfe_005918 [Biomphalaria pfeifferi]|uniref:Peptidase S1 domain-containing protein n=1 Tax=Biomphalaria pfeifferi TaxID=112525 RepID=A0AAD8C1J7_BIOPF|nr:hypothetical protein Bpfe_005918 [Biomphalaria pfeifferi]